MAEKRLNILQINSVYGYGSTGRIVRDLHHALLNSGNQSSVIYSRKSAIGKEPGTDYSSEPGVFLIEHSMEQKMDMISSVLFDTNGLHSKHCTEEIIEKIKEINPDLIHLHNIHGFYLNVPMLFRFLKDYGKPVLWTLHDCWSYTGYCAYYDYHQCDNWKTGCLRCPYRDTYPYRVFSHSAANWQWKKQAYEGMNLNLAVPSQWLRNELQQSILQDKPCTVIHNSIDTGIFYEESSNLRTQYHLEGKKLYLACANLWTMPKGFGELKKLSAMLNDNEVLIIIGLSEKQQKEFHEHVFPLGNMDSASLRHWYSAADCFVNLTLEDNYPTVNLEARACGCPVVTYNTGGSPESAGNLNLVAERGMTEEIVHLLRNHSRDNTEMPEMSGSMCSEYLNLYQKVSGRSK